MLSNAVTNVQANALSTLAALATSSELITSPVVSSPQPRSGVGNINGNPKATVSPVNQDSLATKSRVSRVFLVSLLSLGNEK